MSFVLVAESPLVGAGRFVVVMSAVISVSGLAASVFAASGVSATAAPDFSGAVCAGGSGGASAVSPTNGSTTTAASHHHWRASSMRFPKLI